MKKTLLKMFAVAALMVSTVQLSHAQAGRFLQEVFPTSIVTPNVTYAQNYQVLTGVPTLVPLRMDIYEPGGTVDPLAVRPLVIYLHTGSFIPAILNSNPTGGRKDSTVAEMCRQFSRRGYVAAAVSYRLGWNPISSDQDVRTGSLLQAVYRALQDAKANVRYWREDAALNGNPFRIDTNAIILCGQGTGGYIALAYATLNDVSEINLPKFLSNSNNAAYAFSLGQSYVNQAVWGDFDGYGGNPSLNYDSNHVGYSNAVNFAINMGGAMGDSIWLAAGDVPMIAFHVPQDPFAPFGEGPVYVPTQPPQYVVDVSGSQRVIQLANQNNNNDCFENIFTTDPYSVRANSINGGLGFDGLFPLDRPLNGSGVGEAGPWEWFDHDSLAAFCLSNGIPVQEADTAFQNGLFTNPDMSNQKALAYIDTIQNYIAPRLALCLSLPTGINNTQLLAKTVSVFPNPANSVINITVSQGIVVELIEMIDAQGRIVKRLTGAQLSNVSINTQNFVAGIYSIKLNTNKGIVVKKVSIM